MFYKLPFNSFSEHHQEGDRPEVCLQVCVIPGDFKNGPCVS